MLADFITEGHFGAHIRRMRSLYQSRRDALLDEAARALPRHVTLGPAEAGFHVTAHLPEGTDDRAVQRRAADQGIDVQPLTRYYAGAEPRPGLVLGYVGLSPEAIRAGVRGLAGLV